MANEIAEFVIGQLLGTDDPAATALAMLNKNPYELAKMIESQMFLKRVRYVEERYDVSVVATYDQILSFRARYAANDDGCFVLAVDRSDTRAADEIYERLENIWLEVTLMRKGTREVLVKVGYKNMWFGEKDELSHYAIYVGSYERAHTLVQNVQTL